MPSAPPTNATLVAIRAAHHAEMHPAYDRIVFELSGPLPLLRIEFVKELISDGAGLPVAIAGRFILLVQLSPARAHNDAGSSTAPDHLTPRLPLIKAVVRTGDFEGVVSYGIGLGRKVYPRILTMDNPNRLVIDFLV